MKVPTPPHANHAAQQRLILPRRPPPSSPEADRDHSWAQRRRIISEAAYCVNHIVEVTCDLAAADAGARSGFDAPLRQRFLSEPLAVELPRSGRTGGIHRCRCQHRSSGRALRRLGAFRHRTGTAPEDENQCVCEMIFAFATVYEFAKKNNPLLSQLEPRAPIE
jgi:hypothetical protein